MILSVCGVNNATDIYSQYNIDVLLVAKKQGLREIYFTCYIHLACSAFPGVLCPNVFAVTVVTAVVVSRRPRINRRASSGEVAASFGGRK